MTARKARPCFLCGGTFLSQEADGRTILHDPICTPELRGLVRAAAKNYCGEPVECGDPVCAAYARWRRSRGGKL
jgi:hypothetical protein